MKELKRGGWEIGWHTGKHLSLRDLNHSQTVKELTNWKELFKGLSLPKPYGFSYPWGNYNDKKSEVVSNYFKVARTCDPGVNTPRWLKENPTKLRTIKEPSEMSVNFYEGNVFSLFILSITSEGEREFQAYLLRNLKNFLGSFTERKNPGKLML